MKTPVQMVCAVASMEVVNFVYSRNVFPAILNTFGGLFPVSVLIDLLLYILFDVCVSHLIRSESCTTLVVLLMCSFRISILSLLVTPHIHLSILISFTSCRASCPLVIAQVSAPFNRDGLTSFYKMFPFSFIGILLSRNTPPHLFPFLYDALTLSNFCCHASCLLHAWTYAPRLITIIKMSRNDHNVEPCHGVTIGQRPTVFEMVWHCEAHKVGWIHHCIHSEWHTVVLQLASEEGYHRGRGRWRCIAHGSALCDPRGPEEDEGSWPPEGTPRRRRLCLPSHLLHVHGRITRETF